MLVLNGLGRIPFFESVVKQKGRMKIIIYTVVFCFSFFNCILLYGNDNEYSSSIVSKYEKAQSGLYSDGCEMRLTYTHPSLDYDDSSEFEFLSVRYFNRFTRLIIGTHIIQFCVVEKPPAYPGDYNNNYWYVGHFPLYIYFAPHFKL